MSGWRRWNSSQAPRPGTSGRPLQQITLKPDILIACINRKGRIIIPKGDDTIEPGDTLIVVTTADRMIVDLNDIFADAPERLAAVQ